MAVTDRCTSVDGGQRCRKTRGHVGLHRIWSRSGNDRTWGDGQWVATREGEELTAVSGLMNAMLRRPQDR